MLAISAGILGYLIYSQREALSSEHLAIRPIYLALALPVYLLDLLVAGWVWAGIMNRLGARLPFGRHLRYFCLSLLARRIPGTIWYIASRAALYRQDGVSAKDSSVASGIEAGVATLAAIMGSLLFGLPILTQFAFSAWGLAIALLISLVLVDPRMVAWILKRLGSDAEQFKYRDLFKWLTGYLLAWIIGGFMLWLTANGITEVEPQYIPLFIGSWSLISLVASMFFFSPSNMGVTEVGLTLMLALAVPTSIAALIAIVARLLFTTFEIGVTGGLILLGVGRKPAN